MILLLTESTIPLSIRGISGALQARARRERLDLYKTELLYLDAKRHYKGLEKPTEVAERIMNQQHKDKPVKQVIADILKKLVK